MFLVAITIAGAALLLTHDLPDNTVDRGIQLIIKKDRVEIDYELDMNLKMVAETLRAVNKLPGDWKDADTNSPRAAELLPLIREHMLNVLGRKMTLSINGQPQTLEAIRVEPAAIHTALLRATYRARFRSQVSTVTLEFSDENFADRGGWRRIAAKSRPPAAISESTTQPILIRMTRDLNEPLSAEQVRATASVKVVFQIPEESLDDVAPERATGSALPAPTPSSKPSPAPVPKRPAIKRPHPAWFATAFLLMMLFAFYKRQRQTAMTAGAADDREKR